MKKQWIALFLAFVLGLSLAACGADEVVSSSVAESLPEAPSVAESLPEEEEELIIALNQAFLTGYAKDENYPEGKRITAVMVNNISSARPHNGLSDAKVLVEIKVEGGITRFMALFEDYETMPTVGSVRSARDQFLQLLIPYWGFYIHEGPGGEHPVNWMLRDNDYSEFDLTRQYNGGLLVSQPERSAASYTWYNTSAERIIDTIAAKEADDFRSYSSPMFNFVPYTEPARVPEDGDAIDIAILHSSSYRTLFEYDAGSAKYLMSQFNAGSGSVQPTTDNNNGERLAFDNLVVCFAPMTQYANSPLVKVDYGNGGAGYYISQGKYELILWKKGGPIEPLLLYKWDDNGEMVQVNMGTTYIGIVDDAELPNFHNAMVTGTANEEVAGGQQVENEQDIED